MENAVTTNDKGSYCENCGTLLRGRTDKRFCNDDCRNNFNRKKRKAINDRIPENSREIFGIIKNNYRILLTLYDDYYREQFVDKDVLERQGSISGIAPVPAITTARCGIVCSTLGGGPLTMNIMSILKS